MADIILPIFTAIVGAAAGGAVTELSGRRRYRQQDLRDRTAKIEALVRGLEAAAADYWMEQRQDTDARVLEYKIKNSKKSIGLEITELKSKGFPIAHDVDVSLVALNKAITSSPFEGRPHQSDPARIDRVGDAANSFIAELRRTLKIV